MALQSRGNPCDSRGTAQDEEEKDEELEIFVRTETTTAIAKPSNDNAANEGTLVGYDKYGNAITEANKQLFLDET